MIYNNDLLIISVKPEYAEKILNGEKTIELRKCAPKKVGKDGFFIDLCNCSSKRIMGNL